MALALGIGLSNCPLSAAGIVDLYPDYTVAFDPVNSFYKVGISLTDDLATFLALPEVSFSSDPTSGFNASGYQPTDGMKLIIAPAGLSTLEGTLYVESTFITVPVSGGGSDNSCAWAAVGNAGFQTLAMGQRDSAAGDPATMDVYRFPSNGNFNQTTTPALSNGTNVKFALGFGEGLRDDGGPDFPAIVFATFINNEKILDGFNDPLNGPFWGPNFGADFPDPSTSIYIGWNNRDAASFPTFVQASLSRVKRVLFKDSYNEAEAQAWTA